MTENFKKSSVIVLKVGDEYDDRYTLGRVFPELWEKTVRKKTMSIMRPSKKDGKMERWCEVDDGTLGYLRDIGIDISKLQVEVEEESDVYVIEDFTVLLNICEFKAVVGLKTEGVVHAVWYWKISKSLKVDEGDIVSGPHVEITTQADTEELLKQAHRKMVGGLLKLFDCIPSDEVERVVGQCGEIVKTETSKTACTYEEIIQR